MCKLFHLLNVIGFSEIITSFLANLHLKVAIREKMTMMELRIIGVIFKRIFNSCILNTACISFTSCTHTTVNG